MQLASLIASVVDSRLKGLPPGIERLPLSAIGRQGWNVLRQDLPLPLAVLKRSSIEHNVDWMRRFTGMTGMLLCPHGKTTMSPQLFEMQLQAGAWGITAATASHVRIYRRYGVGRILLANQLIAPGDIDFILSELRSDADFDFYCLVDSLATVQRLGAAAKRARIGRPLQVLLEVGQQGGRTGVRTFEQGMEVARAVAECEPQLTLRGVEGYEGILEAPDRPTTLRRIGQLMADIRRLAVAACDQGLFPDAPILLTAGGSAYFDFPTQLRGLELSRPTQVVLRSGCYITHDASWLNAYLDALRERMPDVEQLGPALKPALEVWAYVQSVPEGDLVIASLGKRDCSFDIHMPKPLAWHRPGPGGRPQALDERYSVLKLNDHHAYVRVPQDSALRVGDLLCFGIAHPCTTFDKWQLLMVVDDDYQVVDAVRTFF